MKVAAIQHDIVWQDAPATREHVRPLIAAAVEQGAELVVLTEMYATGFSMELELIDEDEGGPNEQFLLAQAAEHGVHMAASIAQRGADGLARNNAVVAAPDGTVAARYAKIHPFSYAGEHERYTAGTEFVTVPIGDLNVSLFVCYDLRFADEFWALAHDTDLYVVPANWPRERREHWRLLLRARAVENQAYVVGVNRVGSRKDLHYAGDSAIIDALGRTLVEASEQPTVLVADIDAATVAAVRRDLPFLPDRR
jgi:predicted amidohydrolase